MFSTRGRAKFGFAFDIDGVLLRGKNLLPKANTVLEMLSERDIPYVLLTNGGGDSERNFADVLRERGLFVSADRIVLAHTPMKNLIGEFRNELCVVFGNKNPINAARLHFLFVFSLIFCFLSGSMDFFVVRPSNISVCITRFRFKSMTSP